MKEIGAKTALMTGSGPTVFGIFDDGFLEKAEKEAKEYFPKEKGWKVYSAHTV